MKQTVVFVVATSIILLSPFARRHDAVDRLKRIALVSFAFVISHLIYSLLSSEPLLLASKALSSSALKANYKYAAAQDATIIIFYNLFIPHGDKATNAINVIKDQMSQVSTALYRLENSPDVNSFRGIVFYNLIGNGDAFPSDTMSDLCHQLHPRLDCQLLQHYENATESVTLSSIYEFCHSDLVTDANQTRVVYLHSKGSYHDHAKQTPWRRALTNSSLHPDCLSPPDDRCDVCGAHYYTMFASMFPGNMWTAKCAYIRQLLPPIDGGEYQMRRQEAIKQFFLLRADGVVHNTFGWHQDVFYGLDRYQWEHWVGGHPSLIPCEMHSPKLRFWDMVDGEVGQEHYEWGMVSLRNC